MNKTKFTIEFNYTLKQLKNAMRKHFGYDKNVKITKRDIKIWIEALLEADIENDVSDKSV
jgi:hypothetical protein